MASGAQHSTAVEYRVGVGPVGGAAAFLLYPHVPTAEWCRLTAGQRDLHTFWFKKFVPLFADLDRIGPEHLPARDRRTIRRLLSDISAAAIPFGPRFGYASGNAAWVEVVRGETRIEGERLTVELLAETTREDAEADAQRLVLRAYGSQTDIEVVLDWRPQEDLERGSVFLRPQAARNNHRFAIAAFNRRQFAGLCEALLSYIGPATPPVASSEFLDLPSIVTPGPASRYSAG